MRAHRLRSCQKATAAAAATLRIRQKLFVFIQNILSPKFYVINAEYGLLRRTTGSGAFRLLTNDQEVYGCARAGQYDDNADHNGRNGTGG